MHVLEKEKFPGMHTSGRNSGVIHAGIYYSTDSLKASFCREGNRRLTQYCVENKLDINRCGKFIVPTNEQEREYMYEIYKQAVQNGVDVRLMSMAEARRIEPLIRGYGTDPNYEGQRKIGETEVIYSPNTSVANPVQVIHCLSHELTTKYGDYCKQFYDYPANEYLNAYKLDRIVVNSK